ncbi:DUF6543 domain-containing protein [Pseudomonas purpurea]|uniref:dermonecrotic toxin domain-containing protein n=1 Tax=Pseudomonas purpurea TaxID=3136737 RepID=UPI003267441D
MTTALLPYFFDEADRASYTREPGEREKQLGFTTADLKWLKRVYLPTHSTRIEDADPMQVSQVLLTPPGKSPMPLAGAFVMSRGDSGEVVLYTPSRGLMKFASQGDVNSKLLEWLSQPAIKDELLRFLSIEQRHSLQAVSAPAISTMKIEGAVFQDQENTLTLNQSQNVKTMLAELIQTPTLQSMLDDTLNVALRKRFTALDQRHTRMGSFASPAARADQRPLSSMTLSEAVLHVYLTNHWPEGELRYFSNPRQATPREDDNQAWEATLKEVAQSLTPRLLSLLETFWNSPMSTGVARSDFFASSMSDAFCLELLLKRQQGVLSAEEHQRLMGACHPTRNLSATGHGVHVEKVRVRAPFKHHVELATTLMLSTPEDSSANAFMYNHARGIEGATPLSEIRATVLAMLGAVGHEDNALDYLALDERDTLLTLAQAEREVIGEPIAGSVFEHLMAQVLAKQTQNLRYALGRYRESEGAMDPGALMDNALDVRSLIDKRLLDFDAAGRWSTRVDQRWSGQPATVRAESARQLSAQLSSIGASLDLEFEKHLVLPDPLKSVDDLKLATAPFLELLPAKLAHTLAVSLRSELKLRTLSHTLSAKDQALINTVLDSPARDQRAALNGFLPDAFSLAVTAGTSPTVLNLANCFVLTERGGLDPDHSGRAILWTPALGFEAFASAAPLKAQLQRRLLDEDTRMSVLENLERRTLVAQQTYTLAPLQVVRENLFNYLQKPYAQLDSVPIERAFASALPEPLLKKLLALMVSRTPATGLTRGLSIAQSLITQQKLPAWLAQAPVADQVLHAELLEQYLNHAPGDKDYLTGLSSLASTAREALKKQLKAVFPRDDIDPDNVELQFNPRLTTTGQTQTLTQFALTHFDDLDAVPIKQLNALDTSTLPSGMDVAYVKKLVRNLKLGQLQQTVLDTAFASGSADAQSRKTRFIHQFPWQMLHYAHSEKLQQRLSATGLSFIAQIMNLPDAIARASVDGVDALIKPLELVATPGAQAARALGLYLIGPREGKSGPHILWAPYSRTHGLKEYESESSLLDELNVKGALQDWVLKCLPMAVRATYKNLWALGGSQPREIKLASNPVTGNLLTLLFDDNAQLLKQLLGSQSDPDTKSDWETVTHVFVDTLEQAFTFMSGKLAYPLTVWHSYREIKASAEALQEHKWGRALKAFINGIAQLAMLRQSMEDSPAAPEAEPDPSLEPPTARRQWQDIDITAPDRTRLHRHESTDVALSALTPDTARGLYTHPTTQKHYAAVDGKVYRVEKRGTPWCITSDKGDGPLLRQLNSRQWTLATAPPPPRYSLVKRLRTRFIRQGAMNVEATGMHSIRQLYPVRARLIDEGLDLATTYAWNSFQNLRLVKTHAQQTTRVHVLLKDFLGVPAVLPDHVTMLEKAIGDVFGALLDAELRAVNSKRFVVGTSREDTDSVFAFTIPDDAGRKLHLLDKFFLPRLDHYRNYMTDVAFPISAHARAVTLIHELSHIASNTHDISYMDSHKPYVDLLETTSTRALALKDRLAEVQREALSSRTPINRLFRVFNPHSGAWEDLGSTTYENSNDALNHVLTLTGQPNLAAARITFMTDPLVRLKVQLGNADSVSWLISHLGRQLDISTP